MMLSRPNPTRACCQQRHRTTGQSPLPLCCRPWWRPPAATRCDASADDLCRCYHEPPYIGRISGRADVDVRAPAWLYRTPFV
jgi:hypothetical protein